MPSKIYLNLFSQYKGDFRAMPAYVNGACGIKWVSVYPDNAPQGLKTVLGIIIYSDPETGYPLAIMDGTAITDMRTGAAGGIAAKYLAGKNSMSLGLIGAGAQSRTQLLAIREAISTIKEVKVVEPKPDFRALATRLAEGMKKGTGLNIWPVETIEEAANADIVVTCTPVRAVGQK